MKARILLLCMLLLCTHCFADDVLRWGVEGGVDMNHLSMDGDYFASKNNRPGWFVGVKGRLAIPLGGLGLDAALLYNNKQASLCPLYENGNPIAATDIQYDTHHLNIFCIPLNIRYNFGIGTHFGVYVATGPQINWYVGDGDRLGFESRLKHQYCSWNIGAGLELGRHFVLGINYCIATESSYTNLRTTATDALDHAFKGKYNSFQARVGWWF